LNRIVILNPKGGCGKSTLATNIAACYAGRGPQPAVMDYDPQGSTMAWLKRRPDNMPSIHGIAAYKKSMQAEIHAGHAQLAIACTRGHG